MLSTTPASGRSDGAQCSWKLDSSTASKSAGCSSTSSTGSPMLPHSRLRRPAGRQHGVQHRRRRGLAVGAGHHQPASWRAVVARRVQPPGQLDVAPDRYACRRRRGQHRSRRRKPGLVTTSAYSAIWVTAAGMVTVGTPLSAYGRSMAGSSSHSVAAAPNRVSAASSARPVTRAPATSTGAPAPGARAGHVRHLSRLATRRRTGPHPDRR